MDLSRHTPGRCPGFHRALLSVVAPARQNRISLPGTSPRPCFGSWICRGTRLDIARVFTAPCFRLSLRRGQAGNNCPKLHRAPASVHEFVAVHARTLPDFSPRPCFRLSLRRGRTESHCPKLHRAMLSVVAPARQNRISLPGTSPRVAFGA